MSKHVFQSDQEGRVVTIEIGWDESLQHYFMQVTAGTCAAGPQANVSECIYSNLGDLTLDCGAADPAYYWNKLNSLGIECPLRTEIDVELQLDSLGGGSNRTVSYDMQSN